MIVCLYRIQITLDASVILHGVLEGYVNDSVIANSTT